MVVEEEKEENGQYKDDRTKMPKGEASDKVGEWEGREEHDDNKDRDFANREKEHDDDNNRDVAEVWREESKDENFCIDTSEEVGRETREQAKELPNSPQLETPEDGKPIEEYTDKENERSLAYLEVQKYENATERNLHLKHEDSRTEEQNIKDKNKADDNTNTGVRNVDDVHGEHIINGNSNIVADKIHGDSKDTNEICDDNTTENKPLKYDRKIELEDRDNSKDSSEIGEEDVKEHVDNAGEFEEGLHEHDNRYATKVGEGVGEHDDNKDRDFVEREKAEVKDLDDNRDNIEVSKEIAKDDYLDQDTVEEESGETTEQPGDSSHLDRARDRNSRDEQEARDSRGTLSDTDDIGRKTVTMAENVPVYSETMDPGLCVVEILPDTTEQSFQIGPTETTGDNTIRLANIVQYHEYEVTDDCITFMTYCPDYCVAEELIPCDQPTKRYDVTLPKQEDASITVTLAETQYDVAEILLDVEFNYAEQVKENGEISGDENSDTTELFDEICEPIEDQEMYDNERGIQRRACYKTPTEVKPNDNAIEEIESGDANKLLNEICELSPIKDQEMHDREEEIQKRACHKAPNEVKQSDTCVEEIENEDATNEHGEHGLSYANIVHDRLDELLDCIQTTPDVLCGICETNYTTLDKSVTMLQETVQEDIRVTSFPALKSCYVRHENTEMIAEDDQINVMEEFFSVQPGWQSVHIPLSVATSEDIAKLTAELSTDHDFNETIQEYKDIEYLTCHSEVINTTTLGTVVQENEPLYAAHSCSDHLLESVNLTPDIVYLECQTVNEDEFDLRQAEETSWNLRDDSITVRQKDHATEQKLQMAFSSTSQIPDTQRYAGEQFGKEIWKTLLSEKLLPQTPMALANMTDYSEQELIKQTEMARKAQFVGESVSLPSFHSISWNMLQVTDEFETSNEANQSKMGIDKSRSLARSCVLDTVSETETDDYQSHKSESTNFLSVSEEDFTSEAQMNQILKSAALTVEKEMNNEAINQLEDQIIDLIRKLTTEEIPENDTLKKMDKDDAHREVQFILERKDSEIEWFDAFSDESDVDEYYMAAEELEEEEMQQVLGELATKPDETVRSLIEENILSSQEGLLCGAEREDLNFTEEQLIEYEQCGEIKEEDSYEVSLAEHRIEECSSDNCFCATEQILTPVEVCEVSNAANYEVEQFFLPYKIPDTTKRARERVILFNCAVQHNEEIFEETEIVLDEEYYCMTTEAAAESTKCKVSAAEEEQSILPVKMSCFHNIASKIVSLFSAAMKKTEEKSETTDVIKKKDYMSVSSDVEVESVDPEKHTLVPWNDIKLSTPAIQCCQEIVLEEDTKGLILIEDYIIGSDCLSKVVNNLEICKSAKCQTFQLQVAHQVDHSVVYPSQKATLSDARSCTKDRNIGISRSFDGEKISIDINTKRKWTDSWHNEPGKTINLNPKDGKALLFAPDQHIEVHKIYAVGTGTQTSFHTHIAEKCQNTDALDVLAKATQTSRSALDQWIHNDKMQTNKLENSTNKPESNHIRRIVSTHDVKPKSRDMHLFSHFLVTSKQDMNQFSTNLKDVLHSRNQEIKDELVISRFKHLSEMTQIAELTSMRKIEVEEQSLAEKIQAKTDFNGPRIQINDLVTSRFKRFGDVKQTSELAERIQAKKNSLGVIKSSWFVETSDVGRSRIRPTATATEAGTRITNLEEYDRPMQDKRQYTNTLGVTFNSWLLEENLSPRSLDNKVRKSRSFHKCSEIDTRDFGIRTDGSHFVKNSQRVRPWKDTNKSNYVDQYSTRTNLTVPTSFRETLHQNISRMIYQRIFRTECKRSKW